MMHARTEIVEARGTRARRWRCGTVLRCPTVESCCAAVLTITPALIEAARKEGKISLLRIELTGRNVGKMFRSQYPDNRSSCGTSGASDFPAHCPGAGSGIHAVDVRQQYRTRHILTGRRTAGCAYLPMIAKHFSSDQLILEGLIYVLACLEPSFTNTLINARMTPESLRRPL